MRRLLTHVFTGLVGGLPEVAPETRSGGGSNDCRQVSRSCRGRGEMSGPHPLLFSQPGLVLEARCQ